ncbi:hypothetical protein [Pseudooceanicola batsensis]|uniref:hypothetical protein n=1 Tax=Pseudooceanicola batsensis TaxID=314255 RepID=UPI00032196A2|nr:hypothetical protein [Pseudooceanicola batsensis]
MIQTVLGADLPASIQNEILEVVVDTMANGQIGGSIDNFGTWTYDRSSGRYYTVSNSGDVVFATPAQQEYLDARRDVRLNLDSHDLNHLDEIIEQLDRHSYCFIRDGCPDH